MTITVANITRQTFRLFVSQPNGNTEFTVPYGGTVSIPTALQAAAIAQLGPYGLVPLATALAGSGITGLTYAQDAVIGQLDINTLTQRNLTIGLQGGGVNVIIP
jgi:hypothetical protein